MQVNLTTGTIFTAFGTPLQSSSSNIGDGGPASLAKMYSPYSIASDGSQGYFIADFLSDNVRRVYQNLSISAFAGTTAGSGVSI